MRQFTSLTIWMKHLTAIPYVEVRRGFDEKNCVRCVRLSRCAYKRKLKLGSVTVECATLRHFSACVSAFVMMHNYHQVSWLTICLVACVLSVGETPR